MFFKNILEVLHKNCHIGVLQLKHTEITSWDLAKLNVEYTGVDFITKVNIGTIAV